MNNNNNNNNIDIELDYYDKILDRFKNFKLNPESIEIWKNKSFIELMQLLEKKKNRILVVNAIIIILSLFEDNPPDIYNERGTKLSKVQDKEKNYVIDRLKDEFLPN